jgi:hypothetical protein
MLGIPWLKLVEELLLECRPQTADNDFDLNCESPIAPVEVEVVRKRRTCRIRQQHTAKRLNDGGPPSARLTGQHDMAIRPDGHIPQSSKIPDVQSQYAHPCHLFRPR